MAKNDPRHQRWIHGWSWAHQYGGNWGGLSLQVLDDPSLLKLS